MKKILILCLFVAAPVFAQSPPDRAGEVAQIARAHPEMFGSDDTRREGLKLIVCGLNQQDGGNWGRLVKLNQGGKIPADIIVWRPTREHFDVLTDDHPIWDNVGVLGDPSWQWSPVDCGAAPPPPPNNSPPSSPPPAPSVDYSALLERIIALQESHALKLDESLIVAKDTNAHVVSMDRTLTQTLGSFSKFVAKYIAPAICGYLIAKQVGAPAAVVGK